jgi:hypothetical protein
MALPACIHRPLARWRLRKAERGIKHPWSKEASLRLDTALAACEVARASR